MAADVGFLVRAMNGDGFLKKDDRRKDSGTAVSDGLVTRDLLGGSFSSGSEIDDSQELDLDLKVPLGWEKRLDLKSGKVYLQKCSNQISRSATKPIQDAKYPADKRARAVIEEANLDLKLVSSDASSLNNTSCPYQSVCTLDKVKSALDRAKNEELRRMFLPRSSKSHSSSSTSTKVTLDLANDEVVEKTATPVSKEHGLLSAAGCPNCLLYVMISKDSPKCPKCHSTVSLPLMKKPRIDLDLNIAIT